MMAWGGAAFDAGVGLAQVETDAEELELRCAAEREMHAAAATGLRSQVCPPPAPLRLFALRLFVALKCYSLRETAAVPGAQVAELLTAAERASSARAAAVAELEAARSAQQAALSDKERFAAALQDAQHKQVPCKAHKIEESATVVLFVGSSVQTLPCGPCR